MANLFETDDEEEEQKPLGTPPASIALPDPAIRPNFPMQDPSFTGRPVVTKSVKDVTTTESRNKITKDQLLAHGRALTAHDEAVDAIKEQTAAQMAEADERHKAAGLLREQSENQAKEDQERENWTRDVFNQRMAAYEAEKQRLGSMGWKGYYQESGSPESVNTRRILGGIAIALGAAGQALTGDKSNAALDTINANVERTYKVWQDRYAAQERSINRAGGDADKAREQFDTALAARKASMRQAIIDKTNELISKTGNQKAKAEGAKLIADQNQRKAAEDEDFAKLAMTHSQTSVHQTITKADPLALLGGAARGLGIGGPGGANLGTTGDPKKDAALSKVVKDYRLVKDMFGDLKKSYEEYGNELDSTDEANRRRGIISRLTTVMKNLQDLGALAGPDAQLLVDQMGKGKHWFEMDNPEVKLKEAEKILDRDFTYTFESNRLKPPNVVGAAPGEAPKGGAAAPAQAMPRAIKKKTKLGTRYEVEIE